MNFPIYTTNGTHYVKHISPIKCITVLPLERVDLTEFMIEETAQFEQFKAGLQTEITETEFNLYKENTIKYLNNL